MIEDEDINMMDGDVTTKFIDGVPTINFSERVHSLVEQSMSKAIILNLLERRVGFNTLLNKIYALQKLKQPI